MLAPPLPPGFDDVPLARLNQYGGLHAGVKAVDAMAVELPATGPAQTWQLRMTRPGGGPLQVDPVTGRMEVEDLFVAFGYEWE